MNLKREISIRTVAVYLIAVATAWILTEVVWGATGGIIAGLSIASNKEYQLKMTSFLEERGIDPQANTTSAKTSYENLSEEDMKELKKMSQKVLAGVNWFYVTLFVSAVVFSLVGFLGGFFARGWLIAGSMPILSFLTNNPVIRFHMAKDLSIIQKVLVIVLAQFVVCYLLAYCGAILGLKCEQRKGRKGQKIQVLI